MSDAAHLATKKAEAPPRLHPLSGANLSTLLRMIVASGPIPNRHKAQVALAVLSAFGRLPFTLLERIYVRIARRRVAPPPIFIIGHWRSGTTHLYNTLAKADDYGFVPPLATGLPWELLTLARWLRPMLERQLPDHRYIDNVPVNPDSPQEDEIALANMTTLSFYHALYFPQRFDSYFGKGVFFDSASAEEISAWRRAFQHFMDKLQILFPERRIVIKNPVYTARVGMLREIYPEARFIHIYRHPYRVFRSMRRFYERLFEGFALQDYDHLDIDRIILDTYKRMMDAVREQTEDLPAEVFIALKYEDLEADPMGQIARIYQQLDLPGFERHRATFAGYLESVQDYKKNRFNREEEPPPEIKAELAPYLEWLGYEDSSSKGDYA